MNCSDLKDKIDSIYTDPLLVGSHKDKMLNFLHTLKFVDGICIEAT